MGIILDGSDGQPLELLVQQAPRAHCEGDFVVATVPVFAGGCEQSTANIQVRMSLEHAQRMAAELAAALKRDVQR